MRFKILVNTFFQLIGKFVSSGFGFLITILLARFYGVSDFGEYIKITAFVSAFWIMGDFGLNAIVLQKYTDLSRGAVTAPLGGGTPPLQKQFNLLLTLRILLALFLIFLCLSILAFLPSGYTVLSKLGIIIFSFSILSQNIHLTTNSIFQHNLVYQKTLIALTVTNAISFILIALCVYLKLPILTVVMSMSLSGIALIIVSLALVKKYVAQISLVFDFSQMRKLMFSAAPLGFVLVFNVLYFHMDSFLLAIMKTNRDVGLYGLAYKFFETLLVIPTFYGNSVYPVLLSRLKTDEAGFHRLFRKSIILLVLISLVTTIATVFLSPLFIKLSTGSLVYAGAVGALQILALSFPIYFLSSIFMWYYVSLNKKTLLLFVYGSSLIVNFVLNLIFIPRFSFMASAAITGISELYILLIFAWVYKRKTTL